MKTHRGTQMHTKKNIPQNRLSAFHRGPSPRKLRHLEKAAGNCLLFTHLSESVGLLRKVCTQHAHTRAHAPSKPNHTIIHTHSYLW